MMEFPTVQIYQRLDQEDCILGQVNMYIGILTGKCLLLGYARIQKTQ